MMHFHADLEGNRRPSNKSKWQLTDFCVGLIRQVVPQGPDLHHEMLGLFDEAELAQYDWRYESVLAIRRAAYRENCRDAS